MRGPGTLFRVVLTEKKIAIYEVQVPICSAQRDGYSGWVQASDVVFSGILTGETPAPDSPLIRLVRWLRQSVNGDEPPTLPDCRCDFFAKGTLYHRAYQNGRWVLLETQANQAVQFEVSADGSSLTWGEDNLTRE